MEALYHSEHISSHQRIFAIIYLHKSYSGIGINKGLLIDLAYAFDISYIIGVLSTEVTGMMRFDLSSGLFVFFLLFQGSYLCFGKKESILCYFGFQCFEAFLKGLQIMPKPYASDGGRRYRVPSFL